MPKPPARLKALADFTPDDHFRAMRGEEIVADEYRRYKADALRAAGLDSEANAAEPEHQAALEDMSPDDHLAELRQR